MDADLARLGVGLLGVFGSALTPTGAPHDLDVVATPIDGAPRSTVDLLGLIELLVGITGYGQVDVGVADGTHPVFDAEALGGLPLYEHRKGAYAAAHLAAVAHRWDTAWIREHDLARMATGPR